MQIGLKPHKIVPTAKLQIVIRTDGSIGMLQPIVIRMVQNQQANYLKFSLAELQMIAAFSNGAIADLEEGLTSYIKSAHVSDAQEANCRRLVKKLVNQHRLAGAEQLPDISFQTFPTRKYSDTTIPEGPLLLKTPCSFLPLRGGFQAITHQGEALPLISSVELHALSMLATHATLESAQAAHQQEVGKDALDLTQFRQLLKPFVAAHYVAAKSEHSEDLIGVFANVMTGSSGRGLREVFKAHAAQQDEQERLREAATGRHRPKVIPVTFDKCVPAGLGAVMACSKSFDNGALDEFYNFRTDWIWDPDRLETFTAEPAIYLFSNYLWSHKQCIEVAAQIKALSPNSITIHGGPDTPRYEQDERNYFETYPQVDVTVRGEGEVTCAEVLAALRQVIGSENPDLEVLRGVKGASYRGHDGVVRNPDRDRVVDLNELPSAYLSGLYDAYSGLPDVVIVLETNRGCPYGCTFCDWGAATASKIRKFDEQRVMAEIAWASSAKVDLISVADANFGVFPRDVDFAREAVRLKKETGYPRGFGGNYAKNTVQYLRDILDVLAEGNILTMGTLSLQTMDQSTLDSISRSNIKTEKYDALAVEMNKAKLPLLIELMMGLPGATLASFAEDLQQCIDRELPARINPTTLLVNSPMNHPDYLAKHQIKTREPVAPGSHANLISTATYTSDDLSFMNELRDCYVLFENFGILRVISRFVHQETGATEIEFYQRLLIRTTQEADWFLLQHLCTTIPTFMAPPVSWYLLLDEIGRFLEQEYGIVDSPERRSILTAQAACLPSHDRNYPDEFPLECDVVSWFKEILAEKARGNRRNWPDQVPKLGQFGPATLKVDDPHGLTSTTLGVNHELTGFGVSWELESPLHRARANLG